ncbi:Tad domain-containing protein [Azoarcus sp. DN11]|uniref:Tad domain-containing protein n=1 Tax=Azoarcus sp. DN11 TaxID=356837 RepID=UPI0013E2A597|nr:Tad domain-containing protein [Azoarcus sp. DN11]
MAYQPVPVRTQRGSVAIITALALVVLVGFAGLALDGGHLYQTKTELQNAADACALAASYELSGTPIPADNFTRGENAGKTVGTENRVDFQGGRIKAADITVSFGPSLTGPWVSALSATGTSKYVQCTVTQSGIAPWFMQVLGFGNQTVNALATATLSPSQNNCAIPMGLCTPPGSSAPNYGYVKGNWYSMNFKESNGGTTANLTGNFRWVDFDPSASTPGCSGGGAQELACLFKGAGQCSLPPNGPATCPTSGNSTPIPGCVGQAGNVDSLAKAFNSRFGICQGGGCTDDDLRNAPPDFSGYGYTSANWALGRNAYAGSSGGTPNFRSARASHLPVESSMKPSGTGSATTTQLTSFGADRRLVTIPFLDCSGFASGQHAPIRGYACVLLLHPYDKVSGNVVVDAEYLGASNEPGSPCATSGAVGSAASVGPLVPALVQ